MFWIRHFEDDRFDRRHIQAGGQAVVPQVGVKQMTTFVVAVFLVQRPPDTMGYPALDLSVIEIDAVGAGTRIHIERSNPIKGVTGKLTILSVMESIKNILGDQEVIRIC